MPPAKFKDLILSYNASNYLFREVLDYLTCRGDTTLGKTINLINKNAFLGVGKILVNPGLELFPRGSFALDVS